MHVCLQLIYLLKTSPTEMESHRIERIFCVGEKFYNKSPLLHIAAKHKITKYRFISKLFKITFFKNLLMKRKRQLLFINQLPFNQE